MTDAEAVYRRRSGTFATPPGSALMSGSYGMASMSPMVGAMGGGMTMAGGMPMGGQMMGGGGMHHMAEMSLDGSREVDPMVKAEAKAEIMTVVEQRQILEDKFQQIDSEHNEDLEEEEFVEGMMGLGVGLSEAEVSELFEYMDVEKEGSVDVIMFVQFFTQTWTSEHLQYLQRQVLDKIRGTHKKKASLLFGDMDADDVMDPFELAQQQKEMQDQMRKILNEDDMRKEKEDNLLRDMEEAEEHSAVDEWCVLEKAETWTKYEVAWHIAERGLEEYQINFLEANVSGKMLMYDLNEFNLTDFVGVKPLMLGRVTRIATELRDASRKQFDEDILFGAHYIPDASENAKNIIANLKEIIAGAEKEMAEKTAQFTKDCSALSAELAVARETIQAARDDGFVFSDEEDSGDETGEAAFERMLQEREERYVQESGVSFADDIGSPDVLSATVSIEEKGQVRSETALFLDLDSEFADLGPSQSVDASEGALDGGVVDADAETGGGQMSDALDTSTLSMDSTAIGEGVDDEEKEKKDTVVHQMIDLSGAKSRPEAPVSLSSSGLRLTEDVDDSGQLSLRTSSMSSLQTPSLGFELAADGSRSGHGHYKKQPSFIVASKVSSHRRKRSSTVGGRKQPPVGTKAWWKWLTKRAEESKTFGRVNFVDQWSAEEVAYWLRRIGFENYATAFVQNKVTAEVLFNDVTHEVLTSDLKVKALHCGRILRKIKELRTKGWAVLIKSEYMNTLYAPPPAEKPSLKLEQLQSELEEKDLELSAAKKEWESEMEVLKSEVVKLEQELEESKKRKPEADDESDAFAKMLLMAATGDEATHSSGSDEENAAIGSVQKKKDVSGKGKGKGVMFAEGIDMDDADEDSEDESNDGDSQQTGTRTVAFATDTGATEGAGNGDEIEVKDEAFDDDESEESGSEVRTRMPASTVIVHPDTDEESEESEVETRRMKKKRAPKPSVHFDARDVAKLKAKLAPLSKTMKHFMIEVTKKARMKGEDYAKGAKAKVWQFDEVCYWLSQIDFVQYIPVFAENKIDGEIVVADLNERILHEDLAVPRFHSGKIMREIRKLKLMCREVYAMADFSDNGYEPAFSAVKRLKELEERCDSLVKELSESKAKVEELLSKPQIAGDEKIIKMSELEAMSALRETLEKQCDCLEAQLQEAKEEALPSQSVEEKKAAEERYIESLVTAQSESVEFGDRRRLPLWTTDEVCLWFHEMGHSQYVANLREVRITGDVLAKDLSAEFLMSRDIGVKRIDVNKIMRDVKELLNEAFEHLQQPSEFMCEHSILPEIGSSAKERFAAYESRIEELSLAQSQLEEGNEKTVAEMQSKLTTFQSQMEETQQTIKEFREKEEAAEHKYEETVQSFGIEKEQLNAAHCGELETVNSTLESVREELQAVSTQLEDKSQSVEDLQCELERIREEEEIKEEENSYWENLERKAKEDVTFCNASRTLQWSIEEVSLWLYKCRSKEYVDAFKENRVDGSVLLNDLSTESLADDLGVKKHHIAKLVREIAKLRSVAKPDLVQSEFAEHWYQPREDGDARVAAETQAAINEALRMEVDKLQKEVERRSVTAVGSHAAADSDLGAAVPPPFQELARVKTEETEMKSSVAEEKLLARIDDLEKDMRRIERSKLDMAMALNDQMEHLRCTVKVLMSDLDIVTETPFGPDPRKAMLGFLGLEFRPSRRRGN